MSTQAGFYWINDHQLAFHPLPAGNIPEGYPVGVKAPDYVSTGLTRDTYLDMMEPIVKMAAEWVDEKGAVIDPVLNKEWGQTSSRFASAGAILLYFNRLPELKEKIYRVLDYTCDKLSRPEVTECSPDFWMRELTVAVTVLTHLAPPEKVERWRQALAKVSPEDVYKAVDKSGETLGQLHNWALFGASGEAMRQAMSIPGPEGVFWGDAFFDRYLEPQYHYFTEKGMYRDPNDPFTYDITTRFQLSCALMWGYRGRNFDKINEILRQGALTTLQYMSPQGYVPFGGRSSQFQFQEAMVAAMSELEALRYRDSQPQIAGMFKRQAHLGTRLIYPYLVEEKPHRHIKNYFAPETLHGCDRYGQYSVYSLLAAGFLGMAALFADDSIQETPTPSEWGSYAFPLRGAFHKIFINCQGNGVEYDTCAQQIEDATGMGRILLKDAPYGLLPAMPFAFNPAYRLAPDARVTPTPLSIGPAWYNTERIYEMHRLASKSDAEDNTYELLEEAPERVSVRLTWEMEGVFITETWTVTPSMVILEGGMSGNCRDGRWEVPMLEYDGKHRLHANIMGHDLICTMDGATVIVNGEMEPVPSSLYASNRNGVYRIYHFPVNNQGCVRLVFKAEKRG